jgi:uncharacterized protein YndB with AHSA1/START domain
MTEHTRTEHTRAEHTRNAIEGTLHSVDGSGVVRMKSRYESDIDDVWSALIDPERLARWYGRVEGDLRVGGEFTALVHGSQWEGRGRIDVCDPPRHLRVTTSEDGGSQKVVTAELVPESLGTVLMIEVRDIPLDKIFAYGAGWQLHVEDLSAHLAEEDCADFGAAWLTRWDELANSYREVAVLPLEC